MVSTAISIGLEACPANDSIQSKVHIPLYFPNQLRYALPPSSRANREFRTFVALLRRPASSPDLRRRKQFRFVDHFKRRKHVETPKETMCRRTSLAGDSIINLLQSPPFSLGSRRGGWVDS